jgi:hypothetical protein
MNLITKEQYLPWVELSVNHKKVLRLLGKGKQNAKISKEIQLVTGFTDKKIRTLVAEMSLYGIDVGSGSRGFYIMMTDEEYEEVYLNFKSRAYGNLRRAKAVKNNPHRDQLMAFLDEIKKEDE